MADFASKSLLFASGADGDTCLASSVVLRITSGVKRLDAIASGGSLGPNTVTTTEVTDGSLLAADIAPTGVTAGTYGGAVTVPQVIVSASGQVTSAVNVPITFPPATVVVDNLTTANATLALSANQGVVLNDNDVYGVGIVWPGLEVELNSGTTITTGLVSTDPGNTIVAGGDGALFVGAPVPTTIIDDLVSPFSGAALSANQGVVLNAADIASVAVAGSVLTLTLKGGGTLTATLPADPLIADNLTTADPSQTLSANQGVVLNAADVASGVLSGTNLVLTLKGGATLSIDVSPLAADIRLQSASFNGGTNSIDFTLTDASTLSVPLSSLLPVTTQQSIQGDGATTALSLVGDVPVPGASNYYGTDGSSARGFYPLPSVTVLDTLASTNTADALSANQGFVLNNNDIQAVDIFGGTTLRVFLKGGGLPLTATLPADPQPATAAPQPPTVAAVVGTSALYAREDHSHVIQSPSASANNDLSIGADALHFFSLQAAQVGVPAVGKFVLGWEDGVLTYFPIA